MGHQWHRLGVFCYVVPGLFALRAYTSWQRGERERPDGWIVFGVFWFLFVALFVFSPPAEM